MTDSTVYKKIYHRGHRESSNYGEVFKTLSTLWFKKFAVDLIRKEI